MPTALRRTVFAVVLTSSACAAAQTGLSPFGAYDEKGIDTIDLSNLNVVLDIPLFEKPGRGVPVSLHLTHNNNIWLPSGASSLNAGWQDPVQNLTGSVTYKYENQGEQPAGCQSNPRGI